MRTSFRDFWDFVSRPEIYIFKSWNQAWSISIYIILQTMKANSDDTVVIPNDYAIGEGNRDIIGGAISIPAFTT